MGEHATTKQAGAARQSASSKRPSVEMSAGDRNDFVDLLLQQAAEAAIAAKNADPMSQLEASSVAITRARAALAALESRRRPTASPGLLRSMDGAYAALTALAAHMKHGDDSARQAQVSSILAATAELQTTLQPLGWKEPRSPDELQARAKAADRAGARVLTTQEKVQLTRLHLGAARQHLLDGWERIKAGKLEPAYLAAGELGEVHAMIVDPHLLNELQSLTADVEITEGVIARVVDIVKQGHKSKLTDLTTMASHIDRILIVLGKDSPWVGRVQGLPAKAPSPKTTSAQDRYGTKSAAPPEHHAVEDREFRRRIYLVDKNYGDEELGAIRLTLKAQLAETGQVYLANWSAIREFDDRATYLKVTAHAPTISSHAVNGERYCDFGITLDIHTGGQTKASEIGGSGKLSGEVEGVGAEIGVQGKWSSSVPQQAAGTIHREYRIHALPEVTKQVDFGTKAPSVVRSRLVLNEKPDTRRDITDFKVDDSEVDGGLFDSDWLIDSDGS